MKVSKFLKALLLATLFGMLLTGCTSKVQLHDSDKSAEGVELENYLPKNAMLAVSINLQDEGQRNDLKAIVEKFPQEKANEIIEGILDEIQMEFDDLETNIKEDLGPIFGDSPRIMLAMSGSFALETEENPDVYLLSTIADPGKLEALLDKWIENDPNYTKDILFNEIVVDNEDDDFYLAIYKDSFILTNKKQLRHEALKRMKNNEESLLSHEMYKKVYEKTKKPNLGTFYLDYENYFDLIAQLQGEEYPMQLKEDFDLAIMMGIYAMNEGVMMLGVPEYGEPLDIPFHEPYLYNGIPGDNLIAYFESYGVKQMVDMAFEDWYEFDEETSKEFRKAELLIKKTVDLDLREDVLSFMDKGVAFVWQRNQTMVPALSLYVDASSNPEGAQEVIDLIDAAMQQAYEDMLVHAPPSLDAEAIIKKEPATIGKSDLHKLSFDFSQMSDEDLLAAGLPSGIFTEPIEFYYGLTANDYFILSTYTGLDKNFGNVVNVSDVNEIQKGRTMLKDYPYNLSYMSVEEAFKYVDQVMTDMEKVQGPMDEEASEAYNAVREFFAPIKYMIGADKLEESAAFVRVD